MEGAQVIADRPTGPVVATMPRLHHGKVLLVDKHHVVINALPRRVAVSIEKLVELAPRGASKEDNLHEDGARRLA
eukprot:scaffold29954_cov80-Phaeocystis_antarctica.AAC.7